ncbi:MAG TPA: ABC transporter permease [Gemmatimonadaceae bacterium]|nr:ABC transporter permease [Gemmatimonadaceae bacterium]
MRKLWIVAHREFVERIRSRWFIVSTVLVPALLGLVIFIALYFTSRATASTDMSHITIIDATATGLGARVASVLDGGATGDTTALEIDVAPPALAAAESTATREVIAGKRKGYLVLGPAVWPKPDVHYAGSNATSTIDMSRLQRIVHDQIIATRLRNAGMDPHQVDALTALDMQMSTERLTAHGRGGSGELSILISFFVAFVLYMTIFFYGQIVLRGVMEEKQTRVAETVVSSVRPETLLFGKILGVGAVAAAQLAILAIVSAVFIGDRASILARMHVAAPALALPHIAPLTALLLVVYFILGYVVYSALFAAIGSMVSSEQDAQQVQMPVAMLLVITALFIQPVIFTPESTLAEVLSYIPFSSPIIMPLRLSLIPIPAWRIALSLATLVAGCWLSVWIASRIYRTGLLMYGKRPSPREVLRWIRASN